MSCPGITLNSKGRLLKIWRCFLFFLQMFICQVDSWTVFLLLQIILYSGDRIYNHYHPALAGRLQFTSSDPKSGDGSVDILNLKSADTGTYQCKVKKAPGVESLKIQLNVLGKQVFFFSHEFQWHVCVYAIFHLIYKMKTNVGQSHTESTIIHPLLSLQDRGRQSK